MLCVGLLVALVFFIVHCIWFCVLGGVDPIV